MTHAALLLMLALPALQDDPQVVYREALFEEVDQGNPDKALELYGKILKSGAPDALKAKALYRSGHCHEKKGRRKEAEQAYRDVMERFSGEAATAKLARERLAVLSSPESTGPVSLDAQIQVLILDLGSATQETRNGAVRKLTLLGESAIPELRRALRHKDVHMCLGAVEALMGQGEFEGLYDAIRPHLGSGIQSAEARVIGALLQRRRELQGRFLDDARGFRDTSLIGSLAPVLLNLDDAAIQNLVEDWLVNPKITNSLSYQALNAWLDKAGDVGMARLIDRMSGGDKPQHEKVRTLASRYSADGKGMPQEIQEALLRALEQAREPGTYLSSGRFPIWMWLLNETEFVKRVLPAWMERGSDGFRAQVLAALAGVRSNQYAGGWQGGLIRSHLFEMLASPKLPLEVRKSVLYQGPSPETPGERANYSTFCLDYWRAWKKSPKSEDEASEKDHPIGGALWILTNTLPPDSKELPEVLDSIIERRSLADSYLRGARAAEIRGPLVAAALRNAKPDAPAIHLVLSIIEELGAPVEKVELGRLMASWPLEEKDMDPTIRGRSNVSIGPKAIGLYCRGVMKLPESDRSAAWKDLMAFYSKLKGKQKVGLVHSLVGWKDTRVDEFMKEASSSEEDSIRSAAVSHWRSRDAKVAVAPLIRALEDKSEEVRRQAAEALGSLRALEAVPALIPLLEGDPGVVRDAASAALKLIREHYEERAEWQRWYDEMKKTLKK